MVRYVIRETQQTNCDGEMDDVVIHVNQLQQNNLFVIQHIMDKELQIYQVVMICVQNEQ
jgi:hypothetical protein